MKHSKHFFAALLALGLLTACGQGAVSGIHSLPLALAEGAATSGAATAVAAPDTSVTEISLSDDSISSTDPSVDVVGSVATITAAGTYRLSGTLTDGEVVVNAGEADLVTMQLDGVDITNRLGPAISVRGAEKVVIELAMNTANHLADGAYPTSGTSSNHAVLSSVADLKIVGDGGLTIRANSADGIFSLSGIAITGGTIDVIAEVDGVTALDYIVLGAPDLSIIAADDGLHVIRADDPKLGYISIAGGRYTIDTGGDAIKAGTDLLIYAGEFEVTNTGANGSTGSSGGRLP